MIDFRPPVTPNIMKSPAIVCTFPNIRPTCKVDEVINLKHHPSTHGLRSLARVVRIPPVQGSKTIHVVSFERQVVGIDYVKLMRHLKMRPCRNAPAYLLGLTVTVSEDEMPAELDGKSIVAAEPDNRRSAFNVVVGQGVLAVPRNAQGYLYLGRLPTHVNRYLDIVFINDNWPICSNAESEKKIRWYANCAFLAEELSD